MLKSTSMAGFFSKKQYAAMADKELAMKLLNERCLECSICVIFFNSSLTVSIRHVFSARFYPQRSSGSSSCCFLFWLSIVCLLRKGFRTKPARYNLCPHRACPLCSSGTFPVFKGLRSSTFSSLNVKLRISPLPLIIRCSSKPKNYPMEHLLAPQDLQKFCESISAGFGTHSGVESTELMPVQVPSRTSLMKTVSCNRTFFSSFTKRL